MEDPVDRIKRAYTRREEVQSDDRYSLWDREALFRSQSLERSVLAILDRHELRPLDDLRILDVGCGTGGVVRDFVRYGANPDNLVGVDLIPERVARAKHLAPTLDLRVANAAELPFEDDVFDLALAFTMFSSITDAALRTEVAAEMLRVLRPGGAVLWYDFWINPINSDVAGLRLAEIRRLFGREPAEARRVTLAPPISRRLAPRSFVACELVQLIPLLRTHWLALIRG
jgi:ubiquinone/menaquinone biosynthesis C-methylase UbiE